MLITRPLSRTLRIAIRPTAARFSTSRKWREEITRFTEAHEWIRLDTDTGLATMGITDYAQNSLGDAVFIELPSIGTQVSAGEQIGGVESVKAASDVFAPLSGEIKSVNDQLKAKSTLLNSSAEKDGWLCTIQTSDAKELDSLMDRKAYNEYTAGEGDH